MGRIKGYFILIFIVLAVLYIVSLIEMSNKYDDELAKLKIENKKLQHQNTEYKLAVESLLDGVECNCGWYEDFYYEHAEELGAYE